MVTKGEESKFSSVKTHVSIYSSKSQSINQNSYSCHLHILLITSDYFTNNHTIKITYRMQTCRFRMQTNKIPEENKSIHIRVI